MNESNQSLLNQYELLLGYYQKRVQELTKITSEDKKKLARAREQVKAQEELIRDLKNSMNVGVGG